MTITKFIRPDAITSNANIGILSTARAIEQEELEPAKNYLNHLGYNVIYGATIGARDNQFAGDDNLRLNDLQTMLDNSEIDAILCARGGYGTTRLLEHIDWHKFRKKPKWIMGYSDITALHNTLSNMGIMSIHGIMPLNIKNETARNAMAQALEIMKGRDVFSIHLPEDPLNHTFNAQGPLTGGNLSMLYSLRGTPYDLNGSGRILFIEDLDEYLYHIDRMMVNFKLGGIIPNVAGIVVGGMTDMNDNTIPFGHRAEEIIASHVPEYVPLFFNAPLGHFDNNLPLVCGANAQITYENKHWKLNYTI